MNPDRVAERGLGVLNQEAAWVANLGLRFNKMDASHVGEGHANLVYAPGEWVEGVLYQLASAHDIQKMDRFEKTPINYSREMLWVVRSALCAPTPDLAASLATKGTAAAVATWTYFANPAVWAKNLRPSAAYLGHLLAGREYLTAEYFQRLQNQPTAPAA